MSKSCNMLLLTVCDFDCIFDAFLLYALTRPIRKSYLIGNANFITNPLTVILLSRVDFPLNFVSDHILMQDYLKLNIVKAKSM